MNPAIEEGFAVNTTTTKPEKATAVKPAANAEAFMLDGPARATDWMVIARCALESVRKTIDSLLNNEQLRLEDEPETLLIVSEELANRLAGKALQNADEASWGFGKIQATMSGVLAMSEDKDSSGARILRGTINDISAYMILIDRAHSNYLDQGKAA